MKGETVNTPDVAASFQMAVVDVLVGHAMKAASLYDVKSFALAGGVASNSLLRQKMQEAADEKGVRFFCPPPVYCTDNGAMIASAGYFAYQKGAFADLSLNAVPGLQLE